MIAVRAFAVAHNLDVPEEKRRFWPQWATVVVARSGVVEDVIQHFDAPSLESNRRHLELYPNSAQFSVRAGDMFATLPEFEAKIAEAAASWEVGVKNA